MIRGIKNFMNPQRVVQRQQAAAAAAAAAANAQGAAAFAAEGEAGKLLRITYKFDAVVAQARAVLEDHQYVTIPFPVGAGADLNAAAAIGAYVAAGTLPDATSEASATAAAEAVTKENLLDVLLRQGAVRALKTTLEGIVFDTRAGDARGPPYVAGGGKLNLSADARPYAGAGGDAKFRALLSCFYGDRLVQPCVRDNQTVYAHMKLVPTLDDACKTALIAAIIADFPPGDELCAALAEAAGAQVPAAGDAAAAAARAAAAAPDAGAGAGAGAGDGAAGGMAGGYRQRQSRQSRYSRRKGRSNRGSRGSRRH